MSDPQTDADLLALTPEHYLARGYQARGYQDPSGAPWPELRGAYVTAATIQLRQGELSPQELGLTTDAIVQIGQLAPDATLNATITEALALVARAIRQANNAALVHWLHTCADKVRTAQDRRAFLAHLQAVNRRYALVVSLRPAPPQA